MLKYINILFFILLTLTSKLNAKENIMILKLKDGDVKIEMFPDVAPNHVKRITELANSGKYDNVVFHRVIDGFMAQTGDVQFGNSKDFNPNLVGRGGSLLPNLPSEFSDKPFIEGSVGMARSQDPNSANSQFFIMFKPAPHLNNNYTIFGMVNSGMEVLNKIKKGNAKKNGVVDNPDFIKKVYLEE